MIEYSARSHIGMVRENNEDNLYVDGIILPLHTRERPFTIDGSTSSPAVFAVCDGMGGEDDGEIASRLAVQKLLNFNERIKSAGSEQLEEAIQSYVNKANEAIHAETSGTNKRTGTTLALAVVSEHGIYCFNMGDSRIYALQKGAFRKITNDHTLVAEQTRNSSLTPNQVMSRKAGHKLTRCIGIGDILTVESYPPIIGTCRFLICSDGLTDMVDTAEIENILCASKRTADAANSLLTSALNKGGKDNVTVIIADFKNSKVSFFRSLSKKLKG
ncbi:protein phosphatase [Desulfitobacterium hafniense]|uniref:Protein phosphatase n=2 Tax=Desulfitobacterium hafniense TaxID=49338 RepID=A0A098B9C1_DESHA|nr:protein phosphatase [Desulfitobacterium hafniense]